MYKTVKAGEPFQLVSNTGGDEPVVLGIYNNQLIPKAYFGHTKIELSLDSQVWQQILDVENYYIQTPRVNGAIFLTNLTPGCYLRIISELPNFEITY